MLSKSFDKPLDKQQAQERIEEEREFQKKMKEVLWLGPCLSSPNTQNSNEKLNEIIPIEFQAILDLVPNDFPPRMLENLEIFLLTHSNSIQKN